jgi:hypothetical protein
MIGRTESLCCKNMLQKSRSDYCDGREAALLEPRKWFQMVSPAFSVPRNKQHAGGALIAKREEWMGAPSQDKTPE